MRVGVRAIVAADVWDYIIPATPVSGSYGEEIKKIDSMALSNLIAGSLGARINDLQVNRVGVEGATSLADKLTLTRAGYLDNLPNLDAAVSTRSSHTPDDVRQSVCLATDPIDSIGRRIYDNLDAPVSTAGGVQFTNYSYIATLAAGATYTPPAQAIASAMNSKGGWDDGLVHVEFYDSALPGWRDGNPAASVESVIQIMSDSGQNIRIANADSVGRVLCLTGVTWS